MAVAVFGQLDRLLRERNLTIDDLKRQIEERYGQVIDTAALQRLADPAGVHQVDLPTVASVAMILGIGLDDLFSFEADPPHVDPALEQIVLDEEPMRRIRALLDLQLDEKISDQEQRELEMLVERRVAVTHAYLDQLGRNPERLREFIKRAKRHRASASQ